MHVRNDCKNSDAYLDCVDSEFSESEDDVLLEFGDSSDSSDDDDDD